MKPTKECQKDIKGFFILSLMEARKDISLQELSECLLDSLHQDEWIDFEKILGAEINKRVYGKQNL